MHCLCERDVFLMGIVLVKYICAAAQVEKLEDTNEEVHVAVQEREKELKLYKCLLQIRDKQVLQQKKFHVRMFFEEDIIVCFH